MKSSNNVEEEAMRKAYLVQNPRYYNDPVMAVTQTRVEAMELFAMISRDNEDAEKYIIEVPLFVDADEREVDDK